MKLKDKKIRLPKTGAIYAIILFSVFYSVLLHGQYLTLNNIVNVLRQSSTLCILTIAAFLTILTHQIDLSIGYVASLSGVVMGMMMQAGYPLVICILAAVLSGTAFGALNGVIAGYTTIPPFIITLATMNIAKSVALILNSGTISITAPILKSLNDLQVGFIPFPAILAVILYLFFYWLLKKRRYGTALYAVGGREESALTAGINVKWVKTSVYLIAGTLAGLAGVVYAVRLNSANPTAAAGLELDAICSVVLGGTALTGGQGSIWGAYLGAIAIYMLRNGMNMFGIRIIEQMTVIGIVLILILALDAFNRRKGAVKR